jgi:outer membrane autotransporter protein
VRITWEHEFENDARTIDARLFLNDTSTSDVLASRTDSPDRDYGRVGAGVSAQFAHGISAFVDYDTLIDLRDVEQHRFTAGGRIEF